MKTDLFIKNQGVWLLLLILGLTVYDHQLVPVAQTVATIVATDLVTRTINKPTSKEDSK